MKLADLYAAACEEAAEALEVDELIVFDVTKEVLVNLQRTLPDNLFEIRSSVEELIEAADDE